MGKSECVCVCSCVFFTLYYELQAFKKNIFSGQSLCESLVEEIPGCWSVVKALHMKEEWENLLLHTGLESSNLVQ